MVSRGVKLSGLKDNGFNNLIVRGVLQPMHSGAG